MKKIFPWLLLGFLCFIYFYLVLWTKNDLPLMSYDEAWYASIARNMVATNTWMKMSFNGEPYYDHPPIGFWIMAIFIKFLGESEIVVRLPSMLAAIGSLGLLYLIARQRSKSVVAIIPSLMLGSSLWYIYRARSADLDSMLIFFFILTIYATSQLANSTKKWLWTGITSLALTGLVMIKTLVGIGIVPALVVIVLTSQKRRKTLVYFVVSMILAGLLCFPWYSFSINHYPHFLKYHFLTIGTRDGSNQKINWPEFKETLLYFRSGVGKWYFPAIGSLLTSILLLIRKRFKDKFLWIDLAWFAGVGLPFLLSPKTEVWHLLPLYPPLFLLTIPVIETLKRVVLKNQKVLFELSVVVFVGLVALIQVKSIMPLLFKSIEYDRKDIALQSKPLKNQLMMKAAFLPTFVYYSQKENVEALWLDQKAYELMQTCLTMRDCKQAFVVEYPDYQLLLKDQVEMTINASNSSYLVVSSTQP